MNSPLKFLLQPARPLAAPRRVAYLVNQYPQVSHSFVRREILALERQGFEILRLALRGWDAILPDPEDRLEQSRTLYALRRGLAGLAAAVLATLCARPGAFLRALRLALALSRHSERSLAHHLAYLAEACRLRAWLADFGTTHVHAHFGTNSAEVALLLASLSGGSYSFSVHGPEEFDKPESLHLAEKIRRAAFVVAVSSYGRGQLYRWVEAEHWPKVAVVHCGLEAAFHPLAAGSPPTAPRLVCVGRLCRQKGQLLLLEAVVLLARRGLDCELVLAGDGEMRPQIEAAIVRHGLSGRVRITGWLGGEAVRRELLAARALVLPSFAEGLPVVIMEAFALRRPAIATAVAGIPELVRAGENGWLVPAGSASALADAMAECLAAPPAALMRLGEAGRRRVLRQHSADIEAEKLAELFRRALPGDAGTTTLERRPG